MPHRGSYELGRMSRDLRVPLAVCMIVASGLAGVSLEGRAALVASAIERFEPIDVETPA